MSLLFRRAALPGLNPQTRPLVPVVPSSPIFNHGSRRNLQVWTDAINLTVDGLSWVHQAGVPWMVTFPLAALAVNFTVRLPLQIYTRKAAAKRSELNPLATAWFVRKFQHDVAVGRPRALEPTSWEIMKAQGRVHKAWGVQRYKSLAGVLAFPPFIMISEAIRRLSGAPVGKAGTVLTGTDMTFLDHYDPSLTSGGCLWFTDLTAMDPTYILPIMCSGVLLTTIVRTMPREALLKYITIQGPQDPKQNILQRTAVTLGRVALLSAFIPLIAADLPSAVFVYWLSNFCLGLMNGFFLRRKFPMKSAALSAPIKGPGQRPPFLLHNGHKPLGQQRKQAPNGP